MFKSRAKARLKESIKAAIAEAGTGMTRKEVARSVGVQPGDRDLVSVLDSLISDGCISRAESHGAGYRYWPANLSLMPRSAAG